MKYLPSLFLGFGMLFILGCSENELPTEEEVVDIDLCNGNYAEFYFNDTLFQTMYLPDQGEFLTPDGTSCGIAAALDKNANSLILHIIGEEQHINLRTDLTTLNEEGDFSFLQYTNDNMSSPFNNLILNYPNHIKIEQLDTLMNTINGTFSFKAENAMGDTILVTGGQFSCAFQSF